jgi:hypothetical protein
MVRIAGVNPSPSLARSEPMRRPRFSIASILAIIGIVGIALAAFRDPSYLWANATFSTAYAALVLAIINVLYSRGARRAYCAGFARCGWAFFAICSVPGLRESLCPRLVTEVIFDVLYPHVAPQPPPPAPGMARGPAGIMIQIPGQPGGAVGLVGMAPQAPAPESRWSAWSEPDRTNGVGYPIGTVFLVSSEAFRQIGHSMAALLVGVLGGVYARGRYTAWVTPNCEQEPRREALA